MTWSKESVLKKLTAHNDHPRQHPNENHKQIITKKKLVSSQRRSNKSLIPAAVLVPLVNRKDEITVLLTKRADHLNNHAGQISFPGGQMDQNDRSPEHTALRETEEEIGLTGQLVEVVSHLDDYVVGTGFLVSPVIGFIEPPFLLNPDENEVAEVFEAPLYFITHPDNFEHHTRKINRIERSFVAIQWNDRLIWGATAGILRDLSHRLWSDVQ